MNKIDYRRDTAFLYPNLVDISSEERLRTLGLISQITAIVNLANRELAELVDGGTFSFVNCMPKVHMECISDVVENFTDCDNVRICVTSYNSYDYTNNYDALIQRYRHGKTGISHLVALRITGHPQKVQFTPDKNDQFDAVITTSLDYLETILVSIMFDISLYHYYGLSNHLPERKRFNETKYNYLLQKYTAKEQEDIYGNAFSEIPIYLPISLPEVRKIDRRIRSDSRQNAVDDMLDAYATFLANSDLSIAIYKDHDGNILQPWDQIPKDITKTVEDVVRNHKDLEEYVIIFLNGSTGNHKPIVLQYGEGGKIPCWIEKSCEGKNIYKIVSVKQGS